MNTKTPMVEKKPKTEARRELVDHSPKKDFVCVVVANYNTGHSESQAVLQVTKNSQEAVDTARNAEKLGYRFQGEETGVRVYYLEVGKQYNKALFDLPDHYRQPINYPVIFRRYIANGEWQEEWLNKMTTFIMGIN